MSGRGTLVTSGIVVAVFAGAVGLLFATGIVSLSSSDDGAATDEGPAESADKKAPAAKAGGRKKRRKDKDADKLSSLGYVDGSTDAQIDTSGVTRHDKARVWNGVNFYSSRNQSKADLIDIDGRVLHTWKLPGSGAWQHATLLPNGDVVVLVKNKRVFRLDKDSKKIWEYEGRVHHDLWVESDGTVYALARRNKQDDRYAKSVPTVQDFVLVLDPDGKPVREIPILGAIEKSPYAFLLNDEDALTAQKLRRANPRRKSEFDILHSNHVEVLDGSSVARHPALAKGNLLICPRNTNTIMILEPESGEIVWAWGTSALVFPHHPTVTAEGTILVFNNGTKRIGSQVIEVDPATNDIVWTYGPAKHFYSDTRGSVQRLPNGNTLITESDTGYVFEVTSEGDMVWEFRNPDRKKREKLRMAIWRMTRFDRDSLSFRFAKP